MNLGSVLRLGIQMIERIAIMHYNRFLHRDVKPDNFLIDGPNNPKLLYIIDFGLSKYYIIIYIKQRRSYFLSEKIWITWDCQICKYKCS